MTPVAVSLESVIMGLKSLIFRAAGGAWSPRSSQWPLAVGWLAVTSRSVVGAARCPLLTEGSQQGK